MVEKIVEFVDLCKENNWFYVIEVDGGIVLEIVKVCKDVGVDVFVVGLYIYGVENLVG